MILVFDTETSGLPGSFAEPPTNLENWPRIVQLGYAFYEPNGELIKEVNDLVIPDGFTISEQAFKTHGITMDMATQLGQPIAKVLADFIDVYHEAEILVAHNMHFDFSVTAAEMIRTGMRAKKRVSYKICTKELTTPILKLPNKWPSMKGYKWPSLKELHTYLFNKDFEGAHDALSDVRATASCFFELDRLGHININEMLNKIIVK